jgi:uncharacterized repeat protein (TIGR02543 family)
MAAEEVDEEDQENTEEDNEEETETVSTVLVFNNSSKRYALKVAAAYTVTLQDEDGTELSTTKYLPDELPEGPELTKDEDDDYSYEFAGWTDEDGNLVEELPAVTGDATYTATFNPIPKEKETESGDESGEDPYIPEPDRPTKPKTDQPVNTEPQGQSDDGAAPQPDETAPAEPDTPVQPGEAEPTTPAAEDEVTPIGSVPKTGTGVHGLYAAAAAAVAMLLKRKKHAK